MFCFGINDRSPRTSVTEVINGSLHIQPGKTGNVAIFAFTALKIPSLYIYRKEQLLFLSVVIIHRGFVYEQLITLSDLVLLGGSRIAYRKRTLNTAGAGLRSLTLEKITGMTKAAKSSGIGVKPLRSLNASAAHFLLRPVWGQRYELVKVRRRDSQGRVLPTLRWKHWCQSLEQLLKYLCKWKITDLIILL